MLISPWIKASKTTEQPCFDPESCCIRAPNSLTKEASRENTIIWYNHLVQSHPCTPHPDRGVMNVQQDFALFAPSPNAPVHREVPEAPENKQQTLALGKTDAATFEELGLHRWQAETLRSLAMPTPTPIQRRCIPAILRGCNVLLSAKTGAGKTAAFALPMLARLCEDPFGFFGLVVTPARELAVQVAEQIAAMGAPIHARVALVIGGMDMTRQMLELGRRPHVVVATPGRLAELIGVGALDLSRLRFVVLDEADRLIGPHASFEHDELPTILAAANARAQLLAASATVTPHVRAFMERRCGSSLFVAEENRDGGVVPTLVQRALLVPSHVRHAYLVRLLQTTLADRTLIVFVGKCRACELTARVVREFGQQVAALHSRMPQRQRIAALERFRDGRVRVLVSTDVGSRGLDLPAVQAVVNMDLPADARDYVHRVGRTARAGRGGLALSFVSERDIDVLRSIERHIGQSIVPMGDAPPEKDIVELLNRVSVARRKAALAMVEQMRAK